MEVVPALVSRYRLLHQPLFPWKPSQTLIKPTAFLSTKLPGLNSLVSSPFTQPASSKITMVTSAASSDKNGGADYSSDTSQEGERQTKGMNNGVDKIEKGILMSQKFTLAYAALLGFGGVMGFMKSGSQMSLAVGASSALVLYFVHNNLPTNPVSASIVGLISSATLLVVMWFRFASSGRFFPAGGIAAASLIMSIGYLHGIVRILLKKA